MTVLSFVFFFKQKTAYEMRISDWSSDVCSADLEAEQRWPLDGCLVIHRHGPLEPGDRIVLVITTSAHREAAFEACAFLVDRSEERRVGKECVSTCRSRWSPCQ